MQAMSQKEDSPRKAIKKRLNQLIIFMDKQHTTEEKMPRNTPEMRSRRILQFTAIMNVAYEYGVHVEKDLRDVFEKSLPRMHRVSKREEMKAYDKGWSKLMALLRRYTEINEETNPEWYDSVVDRLTEVIENEVIVELKK